MHIVNQQPIVSFESFSIGFSTDSTSKHALIIDYPNEKFIACTTVSNFKTLKNMQFQVCSITFLEKNPNPQDIPNKLEVSIILKQVVSNLNYLTVSPEYSKGSTYPQNQKSYTIKTSNNMSLLQNRLFTVYQSTNNTNYLALQL